MRSIVRRTLTPLASVAFVTAVSHAHADPAPSGATAKLVTREGATSPWLHLAPKAAWTAMRGRAAPSALRAVDFETRARVALGRVGAVANCVATTTDRFGDGEAIVHFEQVHNGVPVVGRGAAVRLSARGETILTAVDLEENLPASTLASIPPSAAIQSARVDVGTLTPNDAHLVVWPVRGGGSRLAYVVLPQVPAGIPSAPRIVVDAQNGKVLEARDLLQFAKATVHRFNPTKTPGLETLELPLTPSAAAEGKLGNDFVTAMNCVDRKSVRPVSFAGIKAQVHVCNVEQVATADGNGDFLFTPTDVPGAAASRSDEYSELAIYFHTTTAYKFFRDLQGADDAQVVADKPLRVVANLQVPAGLTSGNLAAAANPETPLETFSNAFYSPAGGGLGQIFQQLFGLKGGGLWFGQGPNRDYAYDGDVVYHELTHAVIDRTLRLVPWHLDSRGAIDAPGAMNEGLADYFSSAITGDPDVGEYASKDASQNGGILRTLANQDKCPTALAGEVHFDSTLFSGALWQARTAVPEADRRKFDAALYKAMRTNPGRGDLGFGDLAELFLATLGTDLPAGKTALEASMTERGVLPACERILEFTGAPIKSPSPALGFAAPGTQSLGLEGIAPGIFQMHGKTAGAGTLTVTLTSRVARGGNPLGGQATPYAAAVLVKFGKAITWTASGKHDADLAVDAEGTTAQTATFDVPEDATDVFVQIANKGEADGSYDGVSMAFEPVAAPAPAPAPAEPVTTTSCSTTPYGARARGGLASGVLGGLAIAAGFLRRRRA